MSKLTTMNCVLIFGLIAVMPTKSIILRNWSEIKAAVDVHTELHANLFLLLGKFNPPTHPPHPDYPNSTPPKGEAASSHLPKCKQCNIWLHHIQLKNQFKTLLQIKNSF